MTHEITTSKGTFLFVGTRSAEKEPDDEMLICGEWLWFRDVKIHIPEKGFGKQFLLSTITEDQAREVVEFITDWNGTFYKDYSKKYESHLSTAIDSLRSLMQAERLYVGQPEPGKHFNPKFDPWDSLKVEFVDTAPRTFLDWLIIKVK